MEWYWIVGGIGLAVLVWAGWRRLKRAKQDWDKTFRNGKGIS